MNFETRPREISEEVRNHTMFIAPETGEYAVVVSGDAVTRELVWSIQSVPRHD